MTSKEATKLEVKKIMNYGLIFLFLFSKIIEAGFWSSSVTQQGAQTSSIKSNFGDFRVTATDGTTSLSYWHQNTNISGTSATWVNFPNIPVGTTDVGWIYYTNSAAETIQDFSNVFTIDYPANDPLDNGLLGEWHMNEGTGVTVADSSGNNNTGTMNNVAWLTNNDGGGWGNTQTTFNTGAYTGTYTTTETNYINCGNGNGAFEIPNNITIAGWIYMTSNSGTQIQFGTPYSDTADWIDPYVGFQIGHCNGTFLWINQNGSYGYDVNDNIVREANRWYHIAATFDGANARIYVNGVQTAVAARTSNILYSGAPNFCIGTRKTQCPGEKLAGFADEIRIYNRTLTAAEIQALSERRKSQVVAFSYGAEEASTVLSGWSYRRRITAVNNTGTAITNYQAKIILNVNPIGGQTIVNQ